MTELRTLRTRAKDDPGDSLGWPEALAVTAVIAFLGLLAYGTFNLVLPWIGLGT